ncbi:hypothetical protein Ancab_037074 [Ancistrocladus abbreviatus]
MENTGSSSSAYCALEITIISAEGLSMGSNRPVRKNTFVRVQTDPRNGQYQTCTKVDSQGGSYPAWNEKLVLSMPMQAKFITLEVKCKATPSTGNGEDKLIGGATVPVSDFIGGFAPSNHLHFLSYRLRSLRGEKNGIINFSVKVNGLSDDRRWGYEPKGAWTGTPIVVREKNCRGLVTGVPAGDWLHNYM